MTFYPSEFLAGLHEYVTLCKQGENVFDMGNHALFPTLTNQASWKFSRQGDKLYLSDGTHVYGFHLPTNTSEDEFIAQRLAAPSITDFGKTTGARSGTAQIHRADPGSIYFTLQEGYANPTYTLRHVGGDRWKAIPKKKVAAKAKALDRIQVIIPHDTEQAVKLGMTMEILKQAEGLFNKLNHMAGKGLVTGLNKGVTAALLPGRNPVAAAVVGGLGGLGYHLAKRNLYNTPEENDEETSSDMWKRILAPSLGLGALGMLESNIGHGNVNHAGLVEAMKYYDYVNAGHTPQLIKSLK